MHVATQALLSLASEETQAVTGSTDNPSESTVMDVDTVVYWNIIIHYRYASPMVL